MCFDQFLQTRILKGKQVFDHLIDHCMLTSHCNEYMTFGIEIVPDIFLTEMTVLTEVV